MEKRLETLYDEFRTGLTYREVWQYLKTECDEGKRSHITRHTVLGKWREIKQSMFREFKDYYEQNS